MMFTFDAFVQGTMVTKIPAKLEESLCSTEELFIGHLHNILVSSLQLRIHWAHLVSQIMVLKMKSELN